MRVEKTDEYLDWLDGLKDRTGRARILVRVDRLIEGNPGQHRELTNGVSELKLDFGPGYRVYYTLRGQGSCYSCSVATSQPSRRTSRRRSVWQRTSRSKQHAEGRNEKADKGHAL